MFVSEGPKGSGQISGRISEQISETSFQSSRLLLEASFSKRAVLRPSSEQLPCRSAEVKFFCVFLCQRCREIWREILVKFSALRFPGFGCATENFTKISRQKRCEERKISQGKSKYLPPP